MARSVPSPLGAIVRRHDPDRYLTALFAPAAHRETLFLLYAVNHELARASEVAREPIAALIRLQWWREVAEGARRRHDIAGPLGEALDAGSLLPSDLAGMIEAREAEIEPIATMADFKAYVHGTAGGVMVAAARALGMPQPEPVRSLGAAYGVAGVLRNIPTLARQNRCLLPADLLAAQGLSAGTIDPTVLKPIRQRLSQEALTWLEAKPSVPTEAVAAILPAVLARRDLRSAGPSPERSITDRLAVTLAGLRGRV